MQQRWPIALALGALTVIVLAVAVVLGTQTGGRAPTNRLAHRAAQVPGCGLPAPAFCDDFSEGPSAGGNRSGALDGTRWGVSRANGTENFSTPADAWYPSQKAPCGATPPILPPRDIQICNGQLQETMNDGATVAVLAMYPKQPCVFCGITGQFTFDVGNDSQGNHAAWPELWVTNRPVPAPFSHEATWTAFPEQGLGVRFAGYTNPSGQAATCPGGAGFIGVDSAVVIINSVGNDSFNAGSIHVLGDQCVKQPAAAGQLNHYEVDVSATSIDVFGTDAGTTTPLKHLATINNFGTLGFSRGLIWIEDAHYNGDKFNAQTDHVFVWDNVGFDGPFTYLDLTFDAMDALSGPNADGSVNLGWFLDPNAGAHLWTIPGVTNLSQATAAYVLLNFWHEVAPLTLSYAVNGGPNHTQTWPYPETTTFTWRTLAMPLPLAELRAGSNDLRITPSAAMNVANVDILLVAAGGAGTPTPTPVPTATPSPTATLPPSPPPPPTGTPPPSATPAPSQTSSPTPAPTAVCTIQIYNPPLHVVSTCP